MASDHVITVTHPEGEYQLRVFDHVTVRVRVEEAQVHPHTFQLEILSIHHTPPREEDAVERHQSDIVKVSFSNGCEVFVSKI